MRKQCLACLLFIICLMPVLPVLAGNGQAPPGSDLTGGSLFGVVTGLVFMVCGGAWLYYFQRQNVHFFVGKKDHRKLYMKPQERIVLDVGQDIALDKSLIILFKNTLVQKTKEVVIMNGPQVLSRYSTEGRQEQLKFRYDPASQKVRWD